MADISVRRLSWLQWPEMAPAWERLYNECPDVSFFLSRDWVDCWLATFGEELHPDLLAFIRDRDTVGCCILVWRTEWVRGIPLRRVYLNCAGEKDDDSTCIEFNSLLSLPDCAEAVAQALRKFLENRRWDELHLNGMVESAPICATLCSLGRPEIAVKLSHYVDFSAIRIGLQDFDSVLSSNTRQQVRRSQRLYEQAKGACHFRVAGTCEEAAGILTGLAELHQAAWQERGRPGVFASAKFTGFHRKLIQAAFAQNRIMLAELCAGSERIGALYCFVHRGKVYFYQSGFRYSSDGKMKPGLLTHYFSIRYCLKRPELNEYDFLAGDSQYKRSLATANRPLQWIVVRRFTVPSLLFGGLRWMKRKYVQIFNKSRRENKPVRGAERSSDISVPDNEIGSMGEAHGKK